MIRAFILFALVAALAACAAPPDLPPPVGGDLGPAPALIDLTALAAAQDPATDPGAAVLSRADALRAASGG